MRGLKLMVQFHPKATSWLEAPLHESFETLPTVQYQKKEKKRRFDQYSLHVCAQADCTSVHAMKLAHAEV
jgi:hypothetical protein